MNYSETYFKLDSEEATHYHHFHLICCVYIKELVNTKDQSNACMCEMMSKGSKEVLTLLIVIHVTHVNVTLVIQASEHAQKITSVKGIPTSNFIRTNLISFFQ